MRLTGCEVLPEPVVDGVGKDMVWGKVVLVTVVTTGLTAGFTPLVLGRIGVFGVVWG